MSANHTPMNAYFAIIVGVSGAERFLARNGETPNASRAQRFRSERGAACAADSHLRSKPPVVQRHMSFRVEVAV